MLVLVIFPQLLEIFCRASGFVDAMNGLFTFAVGFSILIMTVLTSIVSVQSEKIKNLIQNSALLEKRIRDLENSGQSDVQNTNNL